MQTRHPELVSGSIHLVDNYDGGHAQRRHCGWLSHNKKQLRKHSAAVINAIAYIQDLILRIGQTPQRHCARLRLFDQAQHGQRLIEGRKAPQSHSHGDCSTTVRFRLKGRNDVKSKAAFTLAEVLITLGIIGIVAALTIPALVQKFQEKAWNTSATVFERKLEEALKVMNTQGTLAGYKNTKDFVSELSNHFKITKVCDTITDCFEDTVYFGAGDADPSEVNMSDITGAEAFGQDEWSTETVGVQFANGTSGVIAYNPDCKQDSYSNQITGMSCLALLYDTTGQSKPNTSGKDLRSINVNKLGSACAFTIKGTCYGTPFTPDNPLSFRDCDTVMDDLGLTSCYNVSGTGDYYAAAVQTYGGISKMPTASQLAEIADEIYHTSGIGADGTYNADLDSDRAASLGFDISSGSFYVWSNQENTANASYSYVRSFYTTNTKWEGTSGNRGSSGSQAVCVIGG